jgi:hypothetical protein
MSQRMEDIFTHRHSGTRFLDYYAEITVTIGTYPHK